MAISKKKEDLHAVVTKKGVAKVLCVVDKGLCSDVGVPTPGFMCVESAVKFALYDATSEEYELGKDSFGDDPRCVADCIREDKIILNDSFCWKSKKSRAKGLRRIAIAQLGSTHITYRQWREAISAELEKTYIPIFLKDELNKIRKVSKNKETQQLYRDLIERLFNEGELNSIMGLEEEIDINPDMNWEDAIDIARSEKELFMLAECAVQACIKLKTKGSKFLYLTKLSKKELKALLKN